MSLLTRKATVVRKPRQGARSSRRVSGPRPSLSPVSESQYPLTSYASNNRLAPSYNQGFEDERSLCRSSSYLSENSHFDETSYGTLFSQIQEVNTESEGPLEFLSRTVNVIWSSLLSTVFLMLLLVFPFTMIGVGSAYRNECPKDPKIPVYLLVGGCFGVLKVILMMWNQRRVRNYEKFDGDDSDDDMDDAVMLRSTKFTGIILNIFLLTWFILGNLWVFRIWIPNFVQPLHEPRNWCHEVVYTYSFYQILVCYGLAGAVILFVTVCLLFYWCSRCTKRQEKVTG